MKREVFAFAALVTVGFWNASTMADNLLFDRGLPTANVNTGDSNQSNVAWADSESTSSPTSYDLAGDDFALGGSGNYQVDDIRVWTVSDTSNLTLVGGLASGPMGNISTNYTVTPVTYSNGDGYQTQSGSSDQIYQIDFTVNLNLTGGQAFDFFVNTPNWAADGASYVNTYLLASNAANSGTAPQDGADGIIQVLSVNGGTYGSVGTWNSETGAGTSDWNGYPGWDETSDIDVQVLGSVVPLPASAWSGLALLGGLGLFGAVKRHRKQMI